MSDLEEEAAGAVHPTDEEPSWEELSTKVLCLLPCQVSHFLLARDLCRLAATCTSIRQSAISAGSQFWARAELCGERDPVAFFESNAHGQFRGVRSLSIQFCNALTDEHLALLPTTVSDLSLDACHAVTDAGIKSVATRCRGGLRSLSLYTCIRLTKQAALQLSLRCPHLESLCLSGCTAIESGGVLALAARCRKLRRLDLTRMPRVDDVALGAVVRANPLLRELRLYADSQFSDTPFVNELAPTCSLLHTLDVTGMNKLTDAALLALAEGCAHLRHLVLSWVVKLTDAGVRAEV